MKKTAKPSVSASVGGRDTMDGMEHIANNLRLRGTSGELAGKWLVDIGLAAKKGTVHRGALPFEDAERHPEKYVVSPLFTDQEDSASKYVTLEAALRHQRILKQAGFETQLV